MNRSQPLPSLPTWKLKHSQEALEDLVKDPVLFDRGYAMNAVSPGELKFPSWAKCRQSGVILEEIQKRMLPAYIGVDLAGKRRPGNAIVVVGLEVSTNRRYLLETKLGAWTSPETAGVLAEVSSRHNVQAIQVENNAYQQSLIDWVKKEKPDYPYWMKIQAFTTGTNKADPDYGLPVLEVEFHNEAWVVPYSSYENHPSTCVCDWCNSDQQVRLYPKAAATDFVMALWFARDAINKWAPRAGGPIRRNVSRR